MTVYASPDKHKQKRSQRSSSTWTNSLFATTASRNAGRGGSSTNAGASGWAQSDPDTEASCRRRPAAQKLIHVRT